MLGRGPAAPADRVQEPPVGELSEQPCHVLGRLVVLAELVRQTRVRVAADRDVGEARQVLDVRREIFGPERAVEPDEPGTGVPDRGPERLDRLPREGPAAAIGDGARDHERELLAPLVGQLEDRVERRPGVQRVEDRLDQQHIGAPLEEALRLLAVRDPQLIEGHGSEGRILDIG